MDLLPAFPSPRASPFDTIKASFEQAVSFDKWPLYRRRPQQRKLHKQMPSGVRTQVTGWKGELNTIRIR